MSAVQESPPTCDLLLERIQARPDDQSAWQDFITFYGPAILRWLRGWGLQPADAADATQAVLLKLARELPRLEYDPHRSFRGWLKTIAHHAWRDLITNRQRLLLLRAEALPLDSLEDRTLSATDLGAAHDQELLDLAVARVQLRVQPQTWSAFRLTALEGRPGHEAAQELGMSLPSIYKAKSNILKMLQAEIRALECEIPA